MPLGGSVGLYECKLPRCKGVECGAVAFVDRNRQSECSAVPRWCIVYSRPAHVDAAGSVTVTFVVPVYALQNRVHPASKPRECRTCRRKRACAARSVLFGVAVPIPHPRRRCNRRSNHCYTVAGFSPTAIRTDDVPVVGFRFVIRVMSRSRSRRSRRLQRQYRPRMSPPPFISFRTFPNVQPILRPSTR